MAPQGWEDFVTWDFANYIIGHPCFRSSFFIVELPTNIFVCVKVFALCFQVPLWLQFIPVGFQPFGCASLQTFRACPWQAYVPCSVGLCPMAEVYQVDTPTASHWGMHHKLNQQFPSDSFNMVELTVLEAWQSPLIPMFSLYSREGSFFRFDSIQ